MASARPSQRRSTSTPSRSTAAALRRALPAAVLLIGAAPSWLPTAARADLVTWTGGSGTWTDGDNTNWFNNSTLTNDEPDPNDIALVQTNVTLTMGTNNSVDGLLFSGGGKLDVNGKTLTIGGDSTFNGGVTGMTLGAGSSVTGYDFTLLSSGSFITLQGGTLTSVAPTVVGSITNFGTVAGYGTVNVTQAPAGVFTVFSNDGTLTATSAFGIFIGAQPAGTLQIHTISSNAHIDLDGGSDNGTVNVEQNQTLRIDGTLSNAFGGTINLYHNSTLNFTTAAWSMGTGGIMNVDNGATGGFPFGTPADVAYINGQAFTQSGGSIRVLDDDGALRFNVPFTMGSGAGMTNNGTVTFAGATSINSGASIVNNGTLVFAANTTVSSGANISMPQSDSSLTVNAGVTATINQTNFNADGTFDTAGNVITVNSGGVLNLNTGPGSDISLSGTVNLNAGTINFQNNVNAWALDGTVNVGGAGTSNVGGDHIQFNSPNVVIAAGSTLNVASTSEFKGGSYTGAGKLRLAVDSEVITNTTINVNTFDPDANDFNGGVQIIIDNGAVFTINSPNFDTDGTMSGILKLGGDNGTLAVNGPASWTMAYVFVTNDGASGTSFINGTSRFVLAGASSSLQVHGNTTVNAPVTFGTNSSVSISTSTNLTLNNDAVYTGATLGGFGRFNPSNVANTVTGNTSINASKFHFSRGNWTVNPSTTLTVNVDDYDPDFAASLKSVDSVITLNSGSLSVNDTAINVFIVDGTLNMNNTTGVSPVLTGEDFQLGRDVGVPDANLAVGGNGISLITPSTTFTSSSHLTIAPTATLVLTGVANFLPVNGANNGSFSGTGTLVVENAANFNEATTLNFAGGTVDLDGRNTDTAGDIIAVNAPLTINAGTLTSFGKGTNLSGTNTIQVDHATLSRTGSLAVNLDNPADNWTVNQQGVLNLLNGGAALTLLSGNALTLNGTLNALGDVRTTARIDVGSTGVVNVSLVGSLLRLGGGSLATPNTIAGGTVNGPGQIGADTGRALVGFGTINAPVAFVGTSELRAKGGTLNVNANVADVGIIGTADGTGTLHMGAVLNLDGTMVCEVLGGGNVNGLSINNDGVIRGNGTVANIINNHTTGILRGVPGGALKFTGPVGLSNGTVDLNTGTVEFTQLLTNAAGTGVIKGPGTFKGDSNLINNGLVKAPAGTTAFFGQITNTSGSSLVIDPNATATFDNDVIVNTGANLTAGAGSINRFFAGLLVNGNVTLAQNVSGTSIANLNIPAGGLFDVANNKLIIDYTGATPADNIRAYILSGRLFSSTANADAQNRMTIGYAEAADLGVGSWSGLPVDTSAVLTKVTWFGDANLDGRVDGDDFALIDQGFQKGLTGWEHGDFNHSGTITPADYMLIDRVYAQQTGVLSPDFLAAREQQFGPDYVASLVGSVPEPTSCLAACGLAVPALARRRRTR